MDSPPTTTHAPATHPPAGEGARHAAPDADVPDLSGYRAVHEAFRSSTGAFIEALRSAAPGDQRRARALRAWFRGLAGELDLHHRLEDDLFFASLAVRLPSYVQYDELVSSDHHRIDEVVAAVRAHLDAMTTATPAAVPTALALRDEAIAAATELHMVMSEHLDFEDADILPLFERHYTGAEYRVLDQQALRSASLRQALFTVPWLIAAVPADVARRMLAEGPSALRLVHRMTRRRYARTTRIALGTSAGAVLVGGWS